MSDGQWTADSSGAPVLCRITLPSDVCPFYRQTDWTAAVLEPLLARRPTQLLAAP